MKTIDLIFGLMIAVVIFACGYGIKYEDPAGAFMIIGGVPAVLVIFALLFGYLE